MRVELDGPIQVADRGILVAAFDGDDTQAVTGGRAARFDFQQSDVLSLCVVKMMIAEVNPGELEMGLIGPGIKLENSLQDLDLNRRPGLDLAPALVSAAISNARNSPSMFCIPPAHLLIRPGPLERMSIQRWLYSRHEASMMGDVFLPASSTTLV